MLIDPLLYECDGPDPERSRPLAIELDEELGSTMHGFGHEEAVAKEVNKLDGIGISSVSGQEDGDKISAMARGRGGSLHQLCKSCPLERGAVHEKVLTWVVLFSEWVVWNLLQFAPIFFFGFGGHRRTRFCGIDKDCFSFPDFLLTRV